MERQGLVKGVVRDVARMVGSAATGISGGTGIRTKAGGFILTKSGLRIKVK